MSSGVGGADRDRTDDLLNAIQALSQLSYSPTKDNVPNALSAAKFLSDAAARGAFYGTAVGCRNATAEAEVWQAAVGVDADFGGARAAEVVAAALGFAGLRGTAEAAGREAGAGRER